MKVHSSARNVNLNRKCGQKHVEPKRFFFCFENKTVTFFLFQMFYSPLGYLAGIMV